MVTIRGPSRGWSFALIVLAQLVAYATLRGRRTPRSDARAEPVDEWIVELDGEDLGRLTGATVTDMFWKTYTLVGSNPRLFDDSLWLHGRFAFRHAISGRRAPHAFCGGLRPTPDAPHVSMRGLYC